MKKILAIVLMMAVLVCPVLASGEAVSSDGGTAAAAETAEDSVVFNYEREITKEATCTEEGIITFYDRSTGEVFMVVTTAPTAHSYEETGSTEATCTEAGSTTYTCSICGETYTEATAPALGHSYTYQYDAVQNEDGSFVSYGTWACDRCGDVVLATEGNAVYYYGLGQEEAAAPAEGEEEAEAVKAAEGEEPVEGAETAEDASASDAVEDASAADAGAGEVKASGYDPSAHNWAGIELVLALIIVAVGAILMLSFGKKKNED